MNFTAIKTRFFCFVNCQARGPVQFSVISTLKVQMWKSFEIFEKTHSIEAQQIFILTCSYSKVEFKVDTCHDF